MSTAGIALDAAKIRRVKWGLVIKTAQIIRDK